MLSTLRALSLVLLCLVSAGVQSHEDYYRYTYNTLLLSDNKESIRLAARAIGRAQLADEKILDVVAAALWRNRQHQHDKEFIDTLSWLAKDLGLSGLPRYRPLLEKCKQEFSHNRKLLNYIEEALEKIPTQSPSELAYFDPETFDFTLAQKDLNELRTTYPNTDKQLDSSITPTTSFVDVIEKIGLPDTIDASIRHENVGHFAKWDASYLRIWYPQFGGIRFTYEKEDSAGWQVLDFWPTVTSHKVSYSGNDWGLAYALWTTDAILLRETARRLYTTRVTNTQTLDVVADRLWLSIHMSNPKYSDAYAWLVRVIEQSNSFRYKQLMRDLIATSPDKKVIRYAEDAVNKLNLPADPYERREELKKGQYW